MPLDAKTVPPRSLPRLSNHSLHPTHAVTAVDAHGNLVEKDIAGERPLTLYVDKRELVTLMTMGVHPELLTLGYLRNQGLVKQPRDIASIDVDWDVEAAAVATHGGIADLDARLASRTITTGCGQGTVFGDQMEELEDLGLAEPRLTQSGIYALLRALRNYNQIYRQAGAVHGCALCQRDEILAFVEDVGRHNAVDTISGLMWMQDIVGDDKIFYTTGRLTSEMVIKVARMGVPALISRNGITRMGLEIGRQLGVTLIARAKGGHFLIFNGAEHVDLDAPPGSAKQRQRDTG